MNIGVYIDVYNPITASANSTCHPAFFWNFRQRARPTIQSTSRYGVLCESPHCKDYMGSRFGTSPNI